jgi:hypothetical protein
VGLRVVAHMTSEDMNDPDMLPDDSWSEDEPLPCYYLGAWEDSLGFLGNHELCKEQVERPQRWFFVFNIIPDTLADVEKAIQKWAHQQ